MNKMYLCYPKNGNNNCIYGSIFLNGQSLKTLSTIGYMNLEFSYFSFETISNELLKSLQNNQNLHVLMSRFHR